MTLVMGAIGIGACTRGGSSTVERPGEGGAAVPVDSATVEGAADVIRDYYVAIDVRDYRRWRIYSAKLTTVP